MGTEGQKFIPRWLPAKRSHSVAQGARQPHPAPVAQRRCDGTVGGIRSSRVGHFFQKLQAKEGNSSQLMKWLSDHPATPDRIAHVTQYIVEHHLTGSDIGTERLAPIKHRLSTVH